MSLRTDRDFDDPCVTQLAVFLQNRVGQLREVLRCLEAAGVAVQALSVTDSADFAVVRLIVDDLDQARGALRTEGYPATESQVLAVELADERSGLVPLTRALIQGEINIHYAYPMLTRPRGRGAVVLHVDSRAAAVEILRRAGFGLLDEKDLLPVD